MSMEYKVFGKIQKPVAEVFDAVYNPQKLSGFFTTGGASGPLDKGTTVTWDFADHPGAFPVVVKETVLNEKIVLEWEATTGGYNIQVEMTFKPLDSGNTLVEIRESGWKETPNDIENSYGNCMGWSQMLCHMKAFVEHVINLREGMY